MVHVSRWAMKKYISCKKQISQLILNIHYVTYSNNYEFQIEMESDKNVKTLRWIEDHASILDDDYENRVPKVQFQKNVKVKPYKPSAKPSSLGKKHSIVQDIDNEYDIQPRHSHGSNQSNESCEEQLENDHYSLRYVSDSGDDSRIL